MSEKKRKEYTIEISVDRYTELCNAQFMLRCLKNCGVENWHYYEDAMDEYNGVDTDE